VLGAYRATAQRRWGIAFRVRLGVDSGPVVVSARDAATRPADLADSAPIHAARALLQDAPPDAIRVGVTAYRAAGDAFAWRRVHAGGADGGALPAYELVGAGGGEGRGAVLTRRGLSRLVGRDAELRQVLAAGERTWAGQGQVVAVVGEAGIGKSRLLYECAQRWRQDGVACYQGSCFSYGEAIAYLPFVQLLRAYFALDDVAAEVEARARIAERLATLPLDAAAVAPYLHHVLAYAVDDARFHELPADLIRARVAQALETLVLAAASRAPLALVVDDLHWIDQASEEVLAALVEAVAASPVLLVLAYRPEALESWAPPADASHGTARRTEARTAALLRGIPARPQTTRVLLESLAAEHSGAIVGAIARGHALPAELEQRIARRAGGNPLFLEELTHALLDEGARPDGALPATVQDVLLDRVDRLPAELKAVLEVAAVIGHVFAYPLLVAVAGVDTPLDELLLRLADRGLVYPTRLAPEREYAFKHVLTQEAVYSTLLAPDRAVYHERVGDAIAARHAERIEEHYELLAYHYARGANADKAVDYLALANHKLMYANAVAEARSHFDQAMRLLDSLPDTPANQRRRLALVIDQQPAFAMLQEMPAYERLLRHYEPVARALGEPGLLGALYAPMASCAWTLGQFRRGLERATRAAALCERAGDPLGVGRAHTCAALCHLSLANYGEVLAAAERAREAFQQQLGLRAYIRTFQSTATAYSIRGDWRRALADGQRALRTAEEFADGESIAGSTACLAPIYVRQGDLERALEYGQQAVSVARTPADVAWSQGVLAWLWCHAGQAKRGVELLATLVPRLHAGDILRGAGQFGLYLGEGCWLAGDYEQARAALTEVVTLGERLGTRFEVAVAYRLLGEVALQEDPARAAPALERSVALLRAIGAESELPLAYAAYGRYHQQRGDLAQAHAYLSRALALLERLGTLHAPDRVRALLAALPAAR
jgi:tetratricopeptide (TPR) repeat protein